MTNAETAAEYVVRQAHARWVRTRLAGRTAFIWRYGVVGWGLPAAALSACYYVIRVRTLTPSVPWSMTAVRPLWGSIVGLTIVCGIVGYLLGAWLWDFCEARFSE